MLHMDALESDRYYSAREVATRLNVTAETVKKHLRDGRRTGKKIGPKQEWHVRGRDVAEWQKDWGLDHLS